MKLASLHCPCNGRDDNPLDHYSSGACPRFPTLIGWIQGILRGIESDEMHKDLTITTTRLTSSCAREVAISDLGPPLEGFDWRKMNSIQWGNTIHEKMQKESPPGLYAEVSVPAPGNEPPIVLGVPMRGKLDCVAGDLSWVADYKTHAESKQRNVCKNPPDKEVVAQLTVYGLMLMRAYDVKMPRLLVTHGAQVSANGPEPWYDKEVQPMSEEEILAMRPYGGTYTVADRIAAYNGLTSDLEMGLPLEEAFKRVPLMGRTMWGAQKCLKYCFVRKYCDQLEGIGTI